MVDSPLVNSQYQQKRTIPVKFSVIQDGVAIETPTAPFLTTIQANGEFDATSKGGGGNNGNFATFEPATMSYSFNLDTKKLIVGPLTISIHTDDGNSWPTDVELK